MNAFKATAIAAVLAFAFSGCTLMQEGNARLQLATQYTVLKTIEGSESITGAAVIETVERVRAVVTAPGDVTIGDLSAQVRGMIRWDRLDAADQLLLSAVLIEAEAGLRKRIGDGLLSADDRVAVGTLLDWIATAALMA